MSALAGIRVIELGQVIAGTFGGRMLADLGAEVIKVEPAHGDIGRNPSVGYMWGESGLFMTNNRGKKSVVIDLKREAGRKVFEDLTRKSDVVIDNFRPGVMERLGLDPEALHRINPRIVCCSVTAFGSTRPESQQPSFDLIHQALSGHLTITGTPGGPPARIGVPIADLSSALFAVQAILAALVMRERTGEGQRVETSMLASMIFLLGYDATLYLNTGEVPRAWGTAHAHQVPWQAFETSDGWIVVATREERFWQSFCVAIDAPYLSEDARFATNRDRQRNREALIPILEQRLRERPSALWLDKLRDAGVPVAPVLSVPEALSQPCFTEAGGITEVEYPPLGTVRMVANPIQMSAATLDQSSPPPRLGEHTRSVLTNVVGYSEQHVARLLSDGVVTESPGIGIDGGPADSVRGPGVSQPA